MITSKPTSVLLVAIEAEAYSTPDRQMSSSRDKCCPAAQKDSDVKQRGEAYHLLKRVSAVPKLDVQDDRRHVPASRFGRWGSRSAGRGRGASKVSGVSLNNNQQQLHIPIASLKDL